MSKLALSELTLSSHQYCIRTVHDYSLQLIISLLDCKAIWYAFVSVCCSECVLIFTLSLAGI